MRIQMKTDNLDKTRWIALVAAVFLMATLSYASTWSLMVNPMIEERGATDHQMAMIMSMVTISGMIFSLIGGKLLDKWGSTVINLTAIFTFAACQFICGITSGVWGFGIANVVLLSWQSSVVYIAVYANVTKLFPDKRGTAIAISGMGITGGSMLVTPFCQWLIDSFGFGMQFYVIGIIFTVVGLAALYFFPRPAEGYVPAGYMPAENNENDTENSEGNTAFVQKDWKMMIKDPAFYMAFLMPILCMTTGQMLNYQLSWMAQDIVKVTPAHAAWMLSGVFLMATLGKLFWGMLADKIGRLNIMIVLAGLSMFAMAGMMFMGEGKVIMFTALAFVGSFASGGHSSTYPALISDMFGSKHYGFNYSICYQSIMIASFVAPWIAVLGRGEGGEGNYMLTFGIVSVMAAVGLVFTIILRIMKKGKLESDVIKK